ncbi:MAG: hypothetical protein ABSG94_08800 [Brevinematales bacterium]|jgi:hypothetical protein
MTLINRVLLLLLLPLGFCFGVHIPDVSYFPIGPNYSENLVSGRSNTIGISLKIEIPRTGGTIDRFILNWYLAMKLSDQKFNYIVTMTLFTNGNMFLNEMRDGAYERIFPAMLEIFPAVPAFDKPLEIGENISFRLIKYYNRFSDPSLGQRTYNNIIAGELNLLDQACLIYFSKDYGIIMIKTGEETFLEK